MSKRRGGYAGRPGRSRIGGVVRALGVGLWFATGCGSEDARPSVERAPSTVTGPASAVDRSTVRPLELPDLSRISASAQTQLNAAHDVLSVRQRTAGAPAADLASAYGDLGKLLMAAGFRDPAEVAFLHARTVAPADFRWPYYLGHVYRLAGDTTRAAASFALASQLKPDDAAALVWWGRAELDRGQPDAAEGPLTRALTFDARSAAALLGLGQVMFEKGDYARALHYLDQARSIDPRAGAIRYALGLTYRALGDSAKAETYLAQRSSEKLVLHDPLMDDVETLLDTAVAYEIRGGQALERRDWAAATADFRRGIELAPDEPSLRHKLGTALAMSGDGPAAIREFEVVARRWPSYAQAQYSLGVIMAGNGRYREAVDRFRAAASNDPVDAQTRLQLASSLQALGRYWRP